MNRDTKLKLKRLAKYVQTGATIAQAFEGPKLAGISQIGRSLVDVLEFDEKDKNSSYFASRGWKRTNLDSLSRKVVNNLTRHPSTELAGRDRDGDAGYLFRLREGRFGFRLGATWVDGVYFPPTQTPEETRELVGRVIWEMYGSKILVSQASTAWDDSIELTQDPISDYFQTQKGPELAFYFRKYQNAGYSRAVLIHGEPGTGKSNLARHAIDDLGGLSVRLKATNLSGLDAERVLDTLKPSGVVIDDLDRAPTPGAILDVWESLREVCPVMIATANDLSKFDRAVLRPGRFDRIVALDRLSEEVVDSLLAGLPSPVRERAKDLPVAYIKELSLRSEVEGGAAALKAVEELEKTRSRILGESDI